MPMFHALSQERLIGTWHVSLDFIICKSLAPMLYAIIFCCWLIPDVDVSAYTDYLILRLSII